MPRKRTESAIEKASRSEEEKRLAKQRSRAAANRRYRHKMGDEIRVKARERMRQRRESMSGEEKARASHRQSQYNYNYYSLNRDIILHKAREKRTQVFVAKHGMAHFINSYPQRFHQRKQREKPPSQSEKSITADHADHDEGVGNLSDNDLPSCSSHDDFL